MNRTGACTPARIRFSPRRGGRSRPPRPLPETQGRGFVDRAQGVAGISRAGHDVVDHRTPSLREAFPAGERSSDLVSAAGSDPETPAEGL